MEQAAWFCRPLKKKENRLAFLRQRLESEMLSRHEGRARQAKPSNTKAVAAGNERLLNYSIARLMRLIGYDLARKDWRI